MKARTKNQKRVVQLDKKVRPIGKRILSWGRENTIKHRGIRYKSGATFCLECGHTWQSQTKQAWQDVVLEQKCECCKRKLKIKSTQNRTDWGDGMITYVDVVGEYQLIRNIEVRATHKVREAADYTFREISRVYLREDGKAEVIGCVNSGGWSPHWQWDFDLRQPDRVYSTYDFQGELYIKWKLQPWITKRGFYNCSYADSKFTVLSFMSRLLLNPHAETILKDGRERLFDYSIKEIKTVENYWRTIKLCMRRGYHIHDPSSYFDMIKAMVFFGKNVEDPKFVCPKNFGEAHDYWIDRKAKYERMQRNKADRIRDQERANKLKKEHAEYNRRMKKFKDLCFTFGDLRIKPLLNIKDVEKAGRLMEHCIYRSTHYWQSKDNLLFGTYENGKLIETTQYSLFSKVCLHSYGPYNKESKHHKKIIGIIKASEHTIAQCLLPKPKVRKKTLKVA